MILNLKLICPHCGARFQMKEATDEQVLSRIHDLASVFGARGWPAVKSYLTAFQTAFDRPLRPEKTCMLLEEIAGFWRDEAFRFQGRDYRISRDVLLFAMRHVGMKEKTGFTNHNYLKKVAIEFQRHQNQKAAREEREREEALRDPSRRDPGGPQKIKGIIDGLKPE